MRVPTLIGCKEKRMKHQHKQKVLSKTQSKAKSIHHNHIQKKEEQIRSHLSHESLIISLKGLKSKRQLQNKFSQLRETEHTLILTKHNL